MRFAFLLLLFAAIGCDQIKSMTPSLPLAAPAEDPKVTAEREAKEREIAITRLRQGDAQVQEWADHIQGEDGKLKHHEGLTEPDPWGNMIHIDYTQDGIYETATIRSAGPDGQFATSDDLIRTRTVTNLVAFTRTGWGITIMTYFLSIPLALVITNAFRQRRVRLGTARKGKSHPVLTALAAPAVVLVYGVVGLVILVGEVIGVATEGIDLPDFDFFD